MSDTNIVSALEKITNELPKDVTLVAVSKTKPDNYILRAYEAGHRDFGENKVQDITKKYERLPKDIRWHFIGHLQRNKVKFITPFVHMIHSVDSLTLLKEIDKRSALNSRQINCLLQISIAEEESKFGLNQLELNELLESEDYRNMGNVKVVGLMGMATNTQDENKIRFEFLSLNQIFTSTKSVYFNSEKSFYFLSMGMTNDYKIAIEEGSNMIRIGSLIFGVRSNL